MCFCLCSVYVQFVGDKNLFNLAYNLIIIFFACDTNIHYDIQWYKLIGTFIFIKMSMITTKFNEFFGSISYVKYQFENPTEAKVSK